MFSPADFQVREYREVMTDLLEIRLIGSFQVTRAQSTLTGFESNKVRALLAYLAVDADRPHQRRKLAALLWPEFPESTALSNLRYALSNLRKVIGDRVAQPAYLEINPQEIRLNLASNILVDVSAFESYCKQGQQNPLDLQSLEEAAELYQGRFLEGFAIPDSSAFEEWVMLEREHIDRLAIQVFDTLANDREISGNYLQAIQFAEQQLVIDPWREAAHRRLMRCLYFSGQRSAALAQFKTCRCELARELSAEPEPATHQLYKQIYAGKLSPPPIPPSFLRHTPSAQAGRTRFVSRQEPLNRLHQALNRALAGQGQLMMVTGSPGQGKSALVHEFIRQALASHAGLAAAWGNNRAYFGVGDPYLPFREILEMFTGQVEYRWAAGSISQDLAHRLWRLMAYSGRALTQDGPDLVGTFLPAKELFQRASMVTQAETSWLSDLQSLANSPLGGVLSSQQDLLKQYCRVLAVIARQAPLLLIVDDLQWADQSSLALLFQISHELKDSRILLVVAFRPLDAEQSSGATTTALAGLIDELRVAHGDITINLDDLEERDLIDAYLDLEPNILDDAFRQELFRYTHGHPLFTIEMLYGMQERGDLVKNAASQWEVSPALRWDKIPARVEAVIAERLRHLPRPLIELLQVASIEGEYFTGEVAAKVLGLDEQQALVLLSSELDRHYKLVLADSTQKLNENRISRYRFRHILYQRYLYSQLNLIERSHLHERIGRILEQHFSSIIDEIAVELAVHFELADCPLKAIRCLNIAARRAAKVSSFEDAITKIDKAREMLKCQPESLERDQLELELLMSLIVPLELARSFAAPELGIVCDRMTELTNKLPLDPGIFPVYVALGSYYLVRAEYKKALASILLGAKLAKTSEDEFNMHFVDYGRGFGVVWLGKFKEALPQFDQMIEFYDPAKHGEIHHLIGTDPCMDSLIWSSWTLWLLGYPDKALERSQKAIELGLALKDPGCLAMSQDLAIYLHLLMNETSGVPDLIQSLSEVLAQHRLPLFSTNLEFTKGYYKTLSGDIITGLEEMKKGIDDYQGIGMRNMLSMLYTLLAQAYLDANQLSQAAQMVQKAEDFIEETDERFYQAETLRVKGELLLRQSPDGIQEVEDTISKAMQVACDQAAKSLELRAAMSLTRLWKKQDRLLEAYQLLNDVYIWFTEGFNTPDLQEARALLKALKP